MKIHQGFALSSVFFILCISLVESTLRIPHLNYGWFGSAKNRGTRHKRYNPKFRPTQSSLTLATFDASPQIYGSHYRPEVEHNPSDNNNYKRETYSPQTTTPGFQPKPKPQYPYSELTPPPSSVVTNPKKLSHLPHHIQSYPTTLQLLTDFNSVEIPASVSIRRPNRYKKHNVYPNDERNEQNQYSHESQPLKFPTESHHPQNGYFSEVNTHQNTGQGYSFGHSQSFNHPRVGNKPPATSFIHNSIYDALTNEKPQTSNNQINENNDLPYSPGFDSGNSSPFASFGQTFRQKRKPASITHQEKPKYPSYHQDSFGGQHFEQYPATHEQQSYSNPSHYQYSHLDEPETEYVSLPEHSYYQGNSFHEETSPSPYADKFTYNPSPTTTPSPYGDQFVQKKPHTTPSPHHDKYYVTTHAPFHHKFISNEANNSPPPVAYTRPPRQSQYYTNYETTTKKVSDVHSYDESVPNSYQQGVIATTTGDYYDYSKYPDYSLNEISNYPTTVAPKIKFENPKTRPHLNRNKKHKKGKGTASSSYTSSSSPHATYKTKIDHNELSPPEESIATDFFNIQSAPSNIPRPAPPRPTRSNNGRYDNGYNQYRGDEFSDYYEADPLHGRASEANSGFVNLHQQTRNDNSISLSTSKGFDQDLNILKDVDPLARLHAIARGETVEEKKTMNSRYEENSLSDKTKKKNQRIDSNYSSAESDFTSFGRRKVSRKPTRAYRPENTKTSQYNVSSPNSNPRRRRTKTSNTAKALSDYLKAKQQNQRDDKKYEDKESDYLDYQSNHYSGNTHKDYDHDHEEGCTTDDGRYYQGGETWDLPGCARAVCAKVLEGGWQVAVDRCTTIRQNPHYLCVFEENKELNFPECCPRAVQCRDNL